MKTKKATKPEPEFDYREMQSIEDAFKRKEIPFESVEEFEKFLKGSTIPERFWGPLIAVYQLFVGYEAVNDDWKADFTKPDPKYWPWARVNSSGSGFVFSTSGYGCGDTITFVGSRLCAKDSGRAQHAFKVYNEQYKKFWLQ